MMRIVAALLVAITAGCAPRPARAVIAPRIAPEVLADRLARADRLAARGCYLCLKEAAAAYAALLGETHDATAVTKALETNLMLAIREAELRIPDSGALEAARQLQDQSASDYSPYFAVLDTRPADPEFFVRGAAVLAKERYAERLQQLAELETDAPASAMKAYFFIASALTLRDFKELKPTVDRVLAMHPLDLSLKYRMLAFQPTYSGEAARALVGQETGFGEVHLLMGQRAFLNGDLPAAFRDLTRARELLPDSVSIILALGNVTLSYARYADALALFDRALSSRATAGYEPQARLGRAKSLSYLRRHEEAIVQLTDLLQNDARNSPGERYYWRAWNHLQLGRAQLAYEDAMAGLNAMRNNAIYQLAGMASFSLDRRDEARKYFEEALKLNAADCDSERYLGLLDSADRSWKPAVSRFTVAAACYETVVARLRDELAEYEKDITGLSSGLIAAKRVEIQEAVALRDQSMLNVSAATRNSR
jgi:tetratricopeptide (TPR) repeat protein